MSITGPVPVVILLVAPASSPQVASGDVYRAFRFLNLDNDSYEPAVPMTGFTTLTGPCAG